MGFKVVQTTNAYRVHEPTHGLDPEARRIILELIKTLAREKTLIVSSHNLSDIDEVCNHAAVLSRGHLIYFGSLQDLKGRMRKNHYEWPSVGGLAGIALIAAGLAVINLPGLGAWRESWRSLGQTARLTETSSPR